MTHKPKIALRGRTAATSPDATPAAGGTLGVDPIASAMDRAAANMPRLLTPEEVAALLGVGERTLERWRINGDGPRYSKLSRSTVRYLPDDVSAFIADHLRSNTAR